MEADSSQHSADNSTFGACICVRKEPRNSVPLSSKAVSKARVESSGLINYHMNMFDVDAIDGYTGGLLSFSRPTQKCTSCCRVSNP